MSDLNHLEALRWLVDMGADEAIGDAPVERPCLLASMAWPVPDAWGEIPRPRLLSDVVVSASGVDFAPLSIAGPGGITPTTA